MLGMMVLAWVVALVLVVDGAVPETDNGCPPHPTSCQMEPPPERALFEAVCMATSIPAERNIDRCKGITSGEFRCACCGALLFDGKDKCLSGTGWPSFSSSVPNAVCSPPESSEVRCASCGLHLGDFFRDPGPSRGCFDSSGAPSRFCIDGVCLLPPHGSGWGPGCAPSPPTHSHTRDEI